MQHQKQRGLTFFGLLIVGIMVAYAGVILAQVLPTYIEYMAVQKAVQKASDGTTVAEVRGTFDKAASIDNITTISGKDLDIGKQGSHTLEEVGHGFEVTRERIRQIEAKALRKLKHPSRSRKMRSFLDQ